MLKQNFFATPNVGRYTLFTLLFQTGMAISLAAMPIYFKNENAISAYGMAYSVMAITGAFSFIYGMFVDRIGFAKALIFGVLLYAIALSMRVFTHPVIAIITAIMAGVGASTAILANRSWVLQITEISTQNTTEITAMRSMIVNISMLVGTGFVSLAVFVFGSVYFWLLLLAGLLIFGASFFAYKNYHHNKEIQHPKTPKPKNTLRNQLTLVACLFVFINLLSGIYVGLLKPYLILMFIDYGISESKSVFIHLLTTFVSIVMGTALLKYNNKVKDIPFTGFFWSMIGYLLAFLLMAAVLFYDLGIWILALAALARTAFSSLFNAFEQVLEYELLDKATLAMVLGFTQTAFLAGDAIGSLVTSLWIIPKNNADYANICIYCIILALVHLGVIFYLKILQTNKR